MVESIKIPCIASDTGTVAFWRSVAPHYGVRAWRSAMRRFAMQHGQAVAHLANDSALIVTRSPVSVSGILETTYPAHRVTWINNSQKES